MHFPERSVLHFNVADFSVAVERVIDSSLKDKAVIIGHLGSSRAVVYDMSEEAFQSGVRKGMKIQQATRICRGATLLTPSVSVYQKAMIAFIKQMHNYTPLIEHGSFDGHVFLDVTGTHRLFGPPPDIGWRLHKEVKKSLQLNPIWTLATNKLIAKVASRLVKPVGEYIVAPGEESDFLEPLPISILPGLAQQEKNKLYEYNLTHIGQLASLDKKQLMVPFGKRSDFIHNISHGIDQSHVVAESQENKSITFEHTFADDTNDQKRIEGLIALLASKVASQLRKRKLTARRIGIWITYSDGGRCVRQATRKRPSDSDFVMTDLALVALTRVWTRRTRIRSCQICCDLFQQQSKQLSLFSLNTKKEDTQNQLVGAMDQIRTKFGGTAILTGLQSRHQPNSLHS